MRGDAVHLPDARRSRGYRAQHHLSHRGVRVVGRLAAERKVGNQNIRPDTQDHVTELFDPRLRNFHVLVIRPAQQNEFTDAQNLRHALGLPPLQRANVIEGATGESRGPHSPRGFLVIQKHVRMVALPIGADQRSDGVTEIGSARPSSRPPHMRCLPGEHRRTANSVAVAYYPYRILSSFRSQRLRS